MTAIQRARQGLPHLALVFLAAIAMIATPGLAKAIDIVNGVYGTDRVSLLSADPLPTPTGPNEVQPFILKVADQAERRQAVECLADAVYYEAGFEPVEGQRAVAQVILNRVRDRQFPNSVCGVVFQGFQRKTGCQFSFVCDGSMKRRPPRAHQEAFSKIVAEQALNGYVVKEVGTATHYHTDYVSPYWAPKLTKITKLGTHIFYRWPGERGGPQSLRDPYEGGEVQVWRMAAAYVLGRA
ncbi:MAG TPA: cell wall hydrolase [Caulobacteraceae bacterium]|nr:cell wall hydrolase [Caulobacteraceae bacterium]